MSKKTAVLTAITAILVVALAVGGIILYKSFAPKETSGSKKVTVTITDTVHGGDPRTEQYSTDDVYLSELLLNKGLVTVENGQYGYFVVSANGITADASQNEYWMIYVNGQFGNYGISEQPVTDGDSYELKLEKY